RLGHAAECDRASILSRASARRSIDSDTGRGCKCGRASLCSRVCSAGHEHSAEGELPKEPEKWSMENEAHGRRHFPRQKPLRETIDTPRGRRPPFPMVHTRSLVITLFLLTSYDSSLSSFFFARPNSDEVIQQSTIYCYLADSSSNI